MSDALPIRALADLEELDHRVAEGASAWTRYTGWYAALLLLMLPITVGVAGRLYPDGVLNQVGIGIVVAAVFCINCLLYMTRPVAGFMFGLLIAGTNLFSLLPSWVYKIQGLMRIDDLALFAAVLASFLVASPAGAPKPVYRRFFWIVLGFVGFQSLYTVFAVGETPANVAREIRPYVHVLWYFLALRFLRDERDLFILTKIILIGTLLNALFYMTQVLFEINFGYADTTYFETTSGATVWRVWQGVPDALLPAMTALLALAATVRRSRRMLWTAFLLLLLCVFLTNTRTYVVIYSGAALAGYVVYLRLGGGALSRKVKTLLVALAATVALFSAAGYLLGVENVLLARFDLTREGGEILSEDTNLMVRILLLTDVIAKVNDVNPLLGLGFVGVGSPITQNMGIAYFDVAQVRNNDIGLATIIGQGGWLFLGLLVFGALWMSLRMYRRARRQQEIPFRIYTVAVMVFLAAQIPVSFTNFGFTSTQVITLIAAGAAALDLLERKGGSPRDVVPAPGGSGRF